MPRPAAAYRICTRCVIDVSDPGVVFDEAGVCNHCRRYDERAARLGGGGEEGRRRMAAMVDEIRRWGRGRPYDCIVGLSGGLDSSFTAFKAVELGLRPLAVHFDSGWNSALAVQNIENVVRALGLDLYTHVCDWEEMRDLQVAFLRASVVNCDIPQDHAFLAALYRTAAQMGLRYVISGHNVATESILPAAYVGHTSHDRRHLRAIHRRFGTGSLKHYPSYGFWAYAAYYPFFKRLRIVRLLDYLGYVREEAVDALKRKAGWREYDGKHGESIFTRFFQGYYLPRKFGIDKRRAHLASLVVSGQMTREEALDRLATSYYTPRRLEEDRRYVLKKLRLTEAEFEAIMRLPPRTYRDYPSNHALFRAGSVLKGRWKRLTQRKHPRPC